MWFRPGCWWWTLPVKHTTRQEDKPCMVLYYHPHMDSWGRKYNQPEQPALKFAVQYPGTCALYLSVSFHLALSVSVCLSFFCLSISRSHLIALPCLFILPCKCSICSGYVHQFSFFITNSSVFLSSSVPAAALFLILCVAS